MNILNVAVVGLGYWGPNVIRNFSLVPQVNIRYGCDLVGRNLVNIQRLYPKIITTKNYQEVIKDKTVDIISISTPLSSHYSLAKEALLANKHVLVEKPFTSTSYEAQELILLAKKQKKIIMTGHTFVYSSAVNKVKEIVIENQLGKIFYFDSTRINLGLLQSDNNVVWDLAVHDFSILNYIFENSPLSLRAMGSSYVSKSIVEDAHIFLNYPKNMKAHVHVSWLSPVKIRQILIGGSKKMIVYNDIEPTEKIRIYNKNVSLSKDAITPFKPAYRSGDIIIPNIEQQEALFNEIKHFIECVLHKKKPLTDGESGRKIVAMLEACDESLATNREVRLL